MFHCGFIVCKSVHNTPAEEYWSHRNRWLAGNSEFKVMIWSYYGTFDAEWSIATYMVMLDADGNFISNVNMQGWLAHPTQVLTTECDDGTN